MLLEESQETLVHRLEVRSAVHVRPRRAQLAGLLGRDVGREGSHFPLVELVHPHGGGACAEFRRLRPYKVAKPEREHDHERAERIAFAGRLNRPWEVSQAAESHSNERTEQYQQGYTQDSYRNYR